MPNLDGTNSTAAPTAQFLIQGMVNGSYATYSDQSFPLRYESIGAQNCTLTGFVNGSLWYQVPNFQTHYEWGGNNIQLNPDYYLWQIDCFAQNGKVTSASASAYVLPSVPTATFWVNGVPCASGSLSVSAANSFTLRYDSSYTTSCDLHGFHYGGNWSWYDVVPFQTAFDWGSVQLVPDTYRWHVDCYGPSGSISAEVSVTVQ